jgi:hypothetical protein
MPDKPIVTSPWTVVEDFNLRDGWKPSGQNDARSRAYCEHLEAGEILFFRELPFNFPVEDREFLLGQKWSELRLHKNVSYRPETDILRGVPGDKAVTDRLHKIFRNYSTQVIEFLRLFLAPYSGKWILDFASFRPLEEENRDLPLHKRNDLLHVDAFPTRPTRGGRILRVFTNLNTSRPRVWDTTEGFDVLARQYAKDAGLERIAENNSLIAKALRGLAPQFGLPQLGRTPYDTFMLRFHDYLKENAKFQAECPKTRLEFPPLSTWIVFTDCVAHSVQSGQFAVEQTLLIPPQALVAPQHAPYRILESIAGKPLVA